MKYTPATGVFLFAVFVSEALAQDVARLTDVQAAVLDQVSRANEQLRDFDPPKYTIREVVVEMHVVEREAMGGGIELQVPLLGSVRIGPEYEQISTVIRRDTYVPLSEISVSPLALNLDEEIVELHEDLRSQTFSCSDFIRKSRQKEVSMIVRRDAGGKFEFVNVFEVGGTLSSKNIHTVKVDFELEEGSVDC